MLFRFGEFNVPYGQKTHLRPVDKNLVCSASALLQSATIIAGDFEHVTKDAKKGDFIYFDPPYTVAHGQNGFIKYNEKIFSWNDQERLAAHARLLASRGCRVVVSNADHQSIHQLYDGFKRQTIERPSVIAASSDHRRSITECVFTMGN